MLGRIIAYAGVVLFTLYCYFLYDHTIVSVMLVMEIIYFAIAVFNIQYMKRKMQFSLVSMPSLAEKNQKITISVNVKNKSKIPMVHFQIVLCMENTFTGEKIKYKVRENIGANRTKNVSVPIKVKECGNIIITLEKAVLFDVLYALKGKIKIKEVAKIGILPECHLIPLEISRKTRDFIADADEYSDSESGDDPSETYQIREYRASDSIHDIHWKLSAKSDELLVKERGKPLGSVVLIWIDLSSDSKSDRKTINKRIINVLELAASLSLSLIEEKCVHMVSWYECENKTVYKKKVSKLEHIYELLHRLMYVRPYERTDEVQVRYEESFKGESFSTIVNLKTNGIVTVGEDRVDIPMEKEEIKWEELFFKL